MIRAFACKVSEATVAFFASPLTVLFFVAGSVISCVWCVAAPTELALTLFLSILALAITAAILYVGERREAVTKKRDEAMHQKLDALLRAVPDAPNALAGIEQEIADAQG